MVRPYIPNRGDIVWLDFTPQSGHEQRGRRPTPLKYVLRGKRLPVVF
ncbi:MAG TPA: type II toxin-antitoxin system PemK/MazF family toxin [Treponemataceae bacterium]|nr:type II toxin-antitoxin system PemK/MazF family toxin [Treponemataceae bacterium]HOS34567.1 type II toxin-antitoxin system PemK/MazF family toxin [Treponemataceae bacterium]HPA10193.1 type II toxin-antitoxin system PemK/MazF family toxin [Treponemataceae bacterium]HPL91639.1 type II toxin-antitoxin system PemK/MazF family toxin [Treponemataceae bacterium]HPX14387.1 type II toxin-antitoxin system PemK/MazF family toxin [Treponemataceae bacterium]